MPLSAPEPADLLAPLRVLAARCAARAALLDARAAQPRPSQGVLFRIGRRRMVVAVDGLREVIEPPRMIAPVPGVAGWVIGIANHRGELLPLFDLRGLLFGARALPPGPGRVLVPRGGRYTFGLLVDEVIGIRGFRVLPEQPSGGDDALARIVRGIFRDETSVLPVVDLARVETLPAFAAVVPWPT